MSIASGKSTRHNWNAQTLYNGQNKTSVLAKFFVFFKQIDDVECACARIKVRLESLDLL